METQGSQGVKKRTVKAVWNKRNTLVFCDICIQAIQKGMRPRTHFSTEGWKYVIQNFTKSGFMYDKVQLKNKWDQLKKERRIWKDLLGKETGLGWDSIKHTIAVPQEWWDEKLKVVPAAAKFQKEGLEPELVTRLDVMFGDTVTNGEFAWAASAIPIRAIPIDDDDNVHINVNVISEDGNLDGERGGDSVDDDFENNVDDLMHNANENVDTQPADGGSRNTKKRGKSGCSSQANANGMGKNVRNKLGGATKLREDISKLVASVESRSGLTSKRIALPEYSISEVMQDVQSLHGVTKGSELYYFAAYIFEQKTKREGYVTMLSPEEKLGWLEFQYGMVKGKNN